MTSIHILFFCMDNRLIPHPAWVEIDLAQFKKNLSTIKKNILSRLFCLCVKADAYGHGICEIATAAEEEGINYLGVACLKEGVELRRYGISTPIFVFGAIDERQIKDLIKWGLEFSVSSKFKAELVAAECAKMKKKCRVHLEIDTGMRRTGVRPETAVELLPWILQNDAIELVGVYSHLATADQPNDPFAMEQIKEFKRLRERFGKMDLIWHLANSGGAAFYPDSHFDMVRCGLLAYGYFPGKIQNPAYEVAPCFSLKARVSYFKVVAADVGISYGHSYRTNDQTRIATVPLGYGDGFFRSFSNRGSVLIRGKKFKIAGSVCMDQFMVDVGQNEVYVGDEATLIGTQGTETITLEEAAFSAGTISYELLCSLNGRLSRIYRK